MDADRRTEMDGYDAPAVVPAAAGMVLAGLILAAVGCSETEFGLTNPTLTARFTLTEDVSGGPSASSDAGVVTVSRSVTVDEGSDFVVDSVHLALRELQVAREGAQCAFGEPGSDTGGDDGRDCLEVFVGTRVDTLPTEDGTRNLLTNARVEPGTLDRVLFRLNVLQRGEPEDDDVLLLRPDLEGASVQIFGSFGGEDFEILLAPDQEVVVQAGTPLTIEDEGSGQMTLAWDVASWFDDPAGDGHIDPLAAEGEDPGGELRSQIASNLVDAPALTSSTE